MIPPGHFMVLAEVLPGRERALCDVLAQMNSGPGQVDPANRLLPFGRFDTLQAAVLLGKLPHFAWEVAERNRIGARYSELLRSSCLVPEVTAGNSHVYAQYAIRVKDRDRLGSWQRDWYRDTSIHRQSHQRKHWPVYHRHLE